MSKLMLIDAAHPEETRVAVVADGQIEDFDFEARDKRQLRGNIYLAKVTRVEPSLQAAFVEYGGNRHGFLAFSEIHPDYYQIPLEDREALLAEEAASARHHDDEEDDDDHDHDSDNDLDGSDDDSDASDNDDEQDDAVAERPRKRSRPVRRYKIQEVIKRRQVMLIQVVKEERGNKGAAVTTYLSLAGRYGVLMPNTARGGGISRKITNAVDRKRLKKIMQEFDVPQGMGLIIRTAGAKRTRAEISRDYDYLIRLWSTIRERTLESVAPCLIHEEGNLVLRAIRDLYDKDVDRIHVEGQDAYDEAHNVISMLMPDHVEKVRKHDLKTPLFISQGVEPQLDNIFSPEVQLPSGGYLVIHQTEALVAIDVNSGKATKERNIEATALKTNLEAAAEACRQMRLRDLAGLIVIDFIDMEENKNNRAVEKKMKDCLSIDRARVQTGRISQFGLFEISRQRRRAGVLELSSEHCKACSGTGRTRSIESAALQMLRAIEERAADNRVDAVSAQAPAEVALYILNHKRDAITQMEDATGATIRIEADDETMPGDFNVEATSDGKVIAYKPIVPIDASPRKRRHRSGSSDEDTSDKRENLAVIDDEDDDDSADASASSSEDEDENAARRRRRGRRGGRRRRTSEDAPNGMQLIDGTDEEDDSNGESGNASGNQSRNDKQKRSRKRRVRRRTPDVAVDGGEMFDAIASAPFLIPEERESEDEDDADENVAEQETKSASAESHPEAGDADSETGAGRRSPRRRRRRRRPNGDNVESASAETGDAVSGDESASSETDNATPVETTVPEPSSAPGPTDAPTALEASSSEDTAPTESQDGPGEVAEIVSDASTAPEPDTVPSAPEDTAPVEVAATAPSEDVAPNTAPAAPAAADDATPPQETTEAKTEEQTLHALHADAQAPAPPPERKRAGWWSKAK